MDANLINALGDTEQYKPKSKKPDCIRCDLYNKSTKTCVYGDDCPVNRRK